LATSLNLWDGTILYSRSLRACRWLFKKVLAIPSCRSIQKVIPNVAQSFNNLSGLYVAQGCMQFGGHFIQKTLILRRGQFFSSRPSDIAQSLNIWLCYMNNQGPLRGSETAFVRGIKNQACCSSSRSPEYRPKPQNLAFLRKFRAFIRMHELLPIMSR